MTEPKNPDDILTEAEQQREQINSALRDVADWFHNHEGKLFEREDAIDLLVDDLDLEQLTAEHTLANIIGDTVDPVVQVSSKDKRHVGIVEFNKHEGAYSYLNYDDVRGKEKRVVCAQCVHEKEKDSNVAHATAGQGSNENDASYTDLLETVHAHYEQAHDTVPEEVETGASLVSGTTMGGNQAWHDGNVTGGTDISVSSTQIDFTGSTFSGNHADLTNVQSNQHHVRPTSTGTHRPSNVTRPDLRGGKAEFQGTRPNGGSGTFTIDLDQSQSFVFMDEIEWEVFISGTTAHFDTIIEFSNFRARETESGSFNTVEPGVYATLQVNGTNEQTSIQTRSSPQSAYDQVRTDWNETTDAGEAVSFGFRDITPVEAFGPDHSHSV